MEGTDPESTLITLLCDTACALSFRNWVSPPDIDKTF